MSPGFQYTGFPFITGDPTDSRMAVANNIAHSTAEQRRKHETSETTNIQ
jgi:hypothetical protein